ncbi:MAG: deoxyguanosinetriphosphate triphosphohydrolase [Clostridiales bacterium]|jgi:dGTPase|nr:deoxyguanosinetriphosphate triphosphohydrolase [Clostridiales bacterium]
MSIRENQEALERQILSPYAVLSAETKGRARAIEPCPLRTDFARDRDRIVHCKSFRRLIHKTQVFLAPEGDHYRTRLTHTLEVQQVARTIARSLRLNEDLTEAIALGHDLGHTPFGHAGERALQQIMPDFHHAKQSLRVVDVLESDFCGLNLTFEVRDGIVNQTSKCNTATLEGKIVSFADRIAYLNHDIDDALRGGILKKSQIPPEIVGVLGDTHSARIHTLVTDVITASMDKPTISMSPAVFGAFTAFKTFMNDTVYFGSVAKNQEEKAEHMLTLLVDYYLKHPEALPKGYQALPDSPLQKVCDYIATMTDHYAIALFERLFVPKGWQG